MAWYEFDQNNSGGSFDIDPSRGIGPSVWIEANEYAEANDIAESLGIYFDGVENDRDCPCCGDRWYRQYGDGSEKPVIYERWAFGWHDEIYLHSRDGVIHALRKDNYYKLPVSVDYHPKED